MSDCAKLLALYAVALATRLACPSSGWAPWGILQASALTLCATPIWLLAGARHGARPLVRAALGTLLALATACTLDSLPDRSHYGVAGHGAVIFFALLAVLWLRGEDRARYGLRLDLRDRRTRRSLVVLVAIFGALFTVMAVLLRKGVIGSPGKPDAPMLETLIFQFVLVAVGEELVWRGFVQSYVDDVLPGRRRVLGAELGWGAAVSALLFALTHMLKVQLHPFTVSFDFQPYRVDVLVMVYLRAYTGSVWPAVAYHGLWNGLGNLLRYL